MAVTTSPSCSLPRFPGGTGGGPRLLPIHPSSAAPAAATFSTSDAAAAATSLLALAAACAHHAIRQCFFTQCDEALCSHKILNVSYGSWAGVAFKREEAILKGIVQGSLTATRQPKSVFLPGYDYYDYERTLQKRRAATPAPASTSSALLGYGSGTTGLGDAWNKAQRDVSRLRLGTWCAAKARESSRRAAEEREAHRELNLPPAERFSQLRQERAAERDRKELRLERAEARVARENRDAAAARVREAAARAVEGAALAAAVSERRRRRDRGAAQARAAREEAARRHRAEVEEAARCCCSRPPFLDAPPRDAAGEAAATVAASERGVRRRRRRRRREECAAAARLEGRRAAWRAERARAAAEAAAAAADGARMADERRETTGQARTEGKQRRMEVADGGWERRHRAAQARKKQREVAEAECRVGQGARVAENRELVEAFLRSKSPTSKGGSPHAVVLPGGG